jgi:hypothetical protein
MPVRRVLAFVLLAACADPQSPAAPPPVPPLAVTVGALDADDVLPGTRALLHGDGFLDGARLAVTLKGQVGAAQADLRLDAERLDDHTLAVTFPAEGVAGLGEGTLAGTLRVEVALEAASGAGEARVSIPVRQALTPAVETAAAGAFPGTPFELRGHGFIDDSEGAAVVELRGTFTRDRDGGVQPIMPREIPTARPDAAQGPWHRDTVTFVFRPEWAGISPGTFDGEIRVIDRGHGWTREGDWAPARFDLLPPVVDEVQPPAASRGQKVTISGQGFLGGEDDGGFTILRLDGTFRTAAGQARPVADLELQPVRLDGTRLVFSMQPRFDLNCESADLGATAGTFEGRVTPVIGWQDDMVEGAPTPLTFGILPTKQVVWLRFLPAFTESLRLFGLRDVSGEIEDRVVEVIRRDYAGINLEVRLAEPTDFLDYSVVEIGGPDPSGMALFGLDNTPGLDQCNQRLDDNLAGRNADNEGAFGGIFVESFLQLSPRRGTENPLANPAFDDIFDPVIDHPVEPGEYPDGPRGEVIGRAIRTLGNLVGNTATHEIGHSLGLPAIVGCGEYHNPPGPLQIMDCGIDRPFEERAELDGHPPAVWHPEDRAYLESILPLQ